MSRVLSVEFLQDVFGPGFVELNPATGAARLTRDYNHVWERLDERGGVQKLAKVFGLTEAEVWHWVDQHQIPELYLPFLTESKLDAEMVLYPTTGWNDSESDACWPESWRYEWDQKIDEMSLRGDLKWPGSPMRLPHGLSTNGRSASRSS